jgi:outer membrane protein, adhesin transport system
VYDRGIAFARTHAAIGTLLQALSLNHIETPSIAEMGDDRFEVDPATACPAEAPSMIVVDKAEAAARAAAANPVVLSMPVAKPEAKPVVVSDEEQLQQALQAWASAWKVKNTGAYLAFYAQEFKPMSGASRDAWVKQRRDALSKPGTIELVLDNIKVRLLDQNQASTAFRQAYRSDSYRDVVSKTLQWRRVDGRWLITQELVGK